MKTDSCDRLLQASFFNPPSLPPYKMIVLEDSRVYKIHTLFRALIKPVPHASCQLRQRACASRKSVLQRELCTSSEALLWLVQNEYCALQDSKTSVMISSHSYTQRERIMIRMHTYIQRERMPLLELGPRTDNLGQSMCFRAHARAHTYRNCPSFRHKDAYA